MSAVKRILLIGVSVVMILALLTAYATPTPEVVAQEPKELKVGLYREMRGLDPAAYEGEPETMATEMLFDRLVCLGDDLAYYPWLATDWEISEDGAEWTFHLRDDVTFHDGTPFTAEAVKLQFDRCVDPETKSLKCAMLMAPYESSEVIDDYTIKVKLEAPYASFLDSLSTGYMGFPSPTALEEWGDEFEDHIVGSGPFKFVEWSRQSYLILERNPDYNWGPPCAENQGPPYIDRLIFNFIPEQGTRVALFDRGEEINATVFPLPDALERWKADPDNVTVLGGLDIGTTWLNTINTAKPPTDDVAVRKAINYAVDRETIVNTLLPGIVEPAGTLLTPSTFGYSDYAPYSYDPEKAQEVLEEAGWVDTDGDGIREKDGEKCAVEVQQRSGQVKDQYKDLLCEYLKAVGIDCKIWEGPQTQRDEFGRAGKVHMVGYAIEDYDPAFLYGMFHSSAVEAYNWCKVENPELDRLLEEQSKAVDPEERKALLEEIQKLVLDEAYILPIHTPYFYWIVRNEVKGLDPGPKLWWPAFQDVRIEE